jgi:septal ring factor EnvC (AmiA/AmiB activator)
MRAALILFALGAPLSASASTPVLPPADPIAFALQQARAEAEAGEKEAQRLEQLAQKALGTAAELRAKRLAAAQAIVAAEARISAADAELRLVNARQRALQQRLRQEQQPVAALLAGLVMMGRRPPLLAIADGGSTDELVRVRILVNSTLPVIRARTAGLSKQINDQSRLKQAAVAARADLQRSRLTLAERREQFAALEAQALAAASTSSGKALIAGDTALAAGETIESLSGDAQDARLAAGVAAMLASEAPAPSGPASSRPQGAPFAYVLPSDAPVLVGLGSVSRSGVRSRGLTLATGRGLPVRTPASGTIRYAGPYRDYDGVVIIDHGGGWMSLIVNVATERRKGERVRLGEPLGRTLGQLEVELSLNGQRLSPAIIAGSSGNLSKAAKGS